jgi:hypothetical protein
MRWAGNVARMAENRNAYTILVQKPEEKRPAGGPKPRCMDNIKMALGEIVWNGMYWIVLAQDRDQSRCNKEKTLSNDFIEKNRIC